MIVTERIPRYDVAQMVELANLRGARIIGPNCLGIIRPGIAKMGGIGGPAKDAQKAYKPGRVGVMSRSGGMTTEISSTLTAAGLGVSTACSIGGDAIIGSTYAELMPLFEADEQTEAIVIYTEPGGRMEAELAAWVTENNSRLPIVAFMAGRFMDEMPGMSFGHAGTIVEGKADTAAEKIKRLNDAGHHRRRGDLRDPGPCQSRSSGGSCRCPACSSTSRLPTTIRDDAEVAQKLEDACPVDIFANKDGKLEIVEENLDECVLCELCIKAAPGKVRVDQALRRHRARGLGASKPRSRRRPGCRRRSRRRRWRRCRCRHHRRRRSRHRLRRRRHRRRRPTPSSSCRR